MEGEARGQREGWLSAIADLTLRPCSFQLGETAGVDTSPSPRFMEEKTEAQDFTRRRVVPASQGGSRGLTHIRLWPGTRHLDSQSSLSLWLQAVRITSNPILSPPLSAHPSRAASEPSRQGATVGLPLGWQQPAWGSARVCKPIPAGEVGGPVILNLPWNPRKMP